MAGGSTTVGGLTQKQSAEKTGITNSDCVAGGQKIGTPPRREQRSGDSSTSCPSNDLPGGQVPAGSTS
eukprot:2935232-Amphidinium_carterae.2